jgi:hypothetical protein
MKTQKEVIKRFREVITPQDSGNGTIPNLLHLFTNLPATPMQSIRPNQQAQPIPPATQQNVQATIAQPEPPPPKLSKNYPYKGAKNG